MNLRSLWIMTEQQFTAFEERRQLQYCLYTSSNSGDEFQHNSVTKLMLRQFVIFMRNRKTQMQCPFKFQKIIHTAICLLRRYYLLNTYLQEDHTQCMISALYLSLKLNEYDEITINKMATKWKEKTVFQPTKHYPHFGDDHYTEQELKFLSGFKFKTGYSKLIQSIEALYQTVLSNIKMDRLTLMKEIMEQLDKVYTDSKIIFLYEGPQLALACFANWLRKKELSAEVLGEQMGVLFENEKSEIMAIANRIDGVNMSNEGGSSELRRLMKKLKFKKPEPRKSSQSPRFQPRHESFQQP